MGKIKEIIPEDFSGAILVTYNGENYFDHVQGYADKPNKVKNELETKFATASAGKFFVAIGIMKLIESGKLRLTDTIGSILTINLNKIDPGITIRQLLTHTSGIPDYCDESVITDYADLWTDFPCYGVRKSQDLLPLFIDKEMMYPAGERFKYNNTGYVVLDLIMETITGMRFDDYLQKHIFGPCGMKDTGYFEMDRLPAKCAHAYIYDEQRNEFYTNIFSVDTKGTGAGGAFTTVIDISRLWKSILNDMVLLKETWESMFSVQASTEENDDYYGFGVWLKKSPSGFIPYFQGCDPGVSFISSYDLKNKVEITITSNLCNNVWEIETNIYNYVLEWLKNGR